MQSVCSFDLFHCDTNYWGISDAMVLKYSLWASKISCNVRFPLGLNHSLLLKQYSQKRKNGSEMGFSDACTSGRSMDCTCSRLGGDDGGDGSSC